MNNCCNSIISLGCISSCEPINTGVTSTVTGTWTAYVSFNGVTLKEDFEGIAGEFLQVPNSWPENMLLTMRLVDPSGNSLADCYSFKNTITVSP